MDSRAQCTATTLNKDYHGRIHCRNRDFKATHSLLQAGHRPRKAAQMAMLPAFEPKSHVHFRLSDRLLAQRKALLFQHIAQ
ncbi:MAG: hypothetical protein KDE24_26485, partial [Caldilinea sp.]|nr:hypothetical protein [Caldilinea sp.]